MDWIGRQTTKFFSWVHVFDPHSPYKPPAELASQLRVPAVRRRGRVRSISALGPLFDRLATLSRPTLVIVTADHGESLGDHGELTHGMFAYEATLRVPLHRRDGPAGLAGDARRRDRRAGPPRRHRARPCSTRSARRPNAHWRAARCARSSGTGRGDDRPLYFEAMTFSLVRGWAPLRGVLVGREKYIDLPIAELYDLAADPAEAKNLATVARPSGGRCSSTPCGPTTSRRRNGPGRNRPRSRRRLRSLGYVSGSAPAKKVYTEDDDPKRLVAVDRDLHAATELYQNGKVAGGDRALHARHRPAARHGRRRDSARARVLGERASPEQAIAALEQRAQVRRARARHPNPARHLSRREPRRQQARDPRPRGAADDRRRGAQRARHRVRRRAAATRTRSRRFNRVLALDPTNGLAYQNLASMTLSQARAAATPAERERLLQEAEGVRAKGARGRQRASGRAHDPRRDSRRAPGGRPTRSTAGSARSTLDAGEFNALYNLILTLVETGSTGEARTYAQQFVSTAPPAFFKTEIDADARVRGRR